MSFVTSRQEPAFSELTKWQAPSWRKLNQIGEKQISSQEREH